MWSNPVVPWFLLTLLAWGLAHVLGGSFVQKPKLSREGSNITLIENGRVVEDNPGEYGEEGYVFQSLAPIPSFNGNHPVMGVWIIDHEAAGLGIREDTRRITGNLKVTIFFDSTDTLVFHIAGNNARKRTTKVGR